MNKQTLVVVVALVIIVGLGAFYFSANPIQAPTPVPQQQATTTGQAALANPASVNCVTTLGGTLEIKDTASGQVGICALPDGRKCEEWGLYRGEPCTDPTANQ